MPILKSLPHAFLFLLCFGTKAQDPRFLRERPSSVSVIPSAALETIREQNRLISQQGRNITWYGKSSTTFGNVCGTCRDMGAENGWDVWQAEEGLNYDSLGLQLSLTAAPVVPRFTITTGPGIDPLTPGLNPGDPPITLVAPPGFGSSSIFLGQRQTDGIGGGCTTQQSQLRAGCAERLTYCFTVGINDTNFIYAYAFVMENPNDSSHTLFSMPYVEFMILDANGDTLPCAYQRYIASESFPGQYTCNEPRLASTGGQGGAVYRDTAIYKPWTVEGVNLSPYIGQTLTVVITNADCQLSGHFAHSYWDFACGSQSAIVRPNCYANAPDTLVAPVSPDTINAYSYEWYLNNNPVPIGYGPVITPYAQNGDTFTVKVITPSGCDWFARYVPQHFTVSTDFGYQLSCGSAVFQSNSYSPSAEDPISFWTWDFPGGTPASSDSSNPGPVYFGPGNHTVTLVSGNYSPGCRDTMQYVIKVPQLPIANFNASDICAGGSVAFINSSSVPQGDTISSYSWSIPGGTPSTSTLVNPSVIFPNPGTSPVSLIVTTTKGCKDTSRSNVVVHAVPVASFTSTPRCIGQTIQLSNTSYIGSLTDTMAFQWTIQGSIPSSSTQTNPVLNFIVPDTFATVLVATSNFGCRDTAYGNVIVHPKPYADFTVPRFCAGDQGVLVDATILSAGDQISTYQWTMPGGTPSTSASSDPSVTYALADTFPVTLIVTNTFGCRDTAIRESIVTPNPTAGFTTSSICFGEALPLQNNSSIQPAGEPVNYQWTITNGTPSSSNQFEPSVTFSAPTTSSITLIATAAGGCADTVTTSIVVNPLPVAQFSGDHACVGSPLPINDLSSVVPGDSMTSYQWTFPGGVPASSASSSPSVTFNQPDTVDVVLIVTNQGGCRDTVSHPVRITPNPTAAFTASNACLGFRPSIFNNSSIRPVGSPMYYNWTFGGGDPATSSDRDPVVDFTSSGSSVINLVVTADGGCSDTTDQAIQIHPLPLADFLVPQVCFGQSVSLTNLSSVQAGDSMSSYSWSMPMATPSSSNAFEPVITYSGLDTVPIRLISTTVHGCKDTMIRDIFVSADPVAQFNVPDVCSGDEVVVENLTSVSPAGSGVTYSWTASGSLNPQSGDFEPRFDFPNSGDYTVQLIATTDGGCSDTLERTVTVHPLPVASFLSVPACEGQPVRTDNTSTIPAGETLQSYSWDFSGGLPSVSSAVNPAVLYPTEGRFDAILTVLTTSGCVDTFSAPLTVHALPVPALPDLDSACIPFCHPFSNTSTSSDGAIQQWNWSFPGGVPAFSDQPDPGMVCYDEPGTYDVSLRIVTEHGCAADTSVTDVIKAYPLPQADFSISSASSGILNPQFTFTDGSSGEIVQWLWNFGDGSPSVLGGPIEEHSYVGSMVGNTFYRYETSLIVTTRYGCMDTILRPLDITPDFTFYIPSAFTPNGDRKNGLFYGKSFGVKEYDIWIFDRWGLELWSCHSEGDNVPWDRYGEEGMSSACKWDGFYEGRRVQQDVYVWKVSLTDVYGKRHYYLGHVTVLY